jgi:hypothetical protein
VVSTDPAVLRQLMQTGKLRVGVAASLTPGAGNVAITPGDEQPKGIGVDLDDPDTFNAPWSALRR